MEEKEEEECPVCWDSFPDLKHPYKCKHGICSECAPRCTKSCPCCRALLTQQIFKTWIELAEHLKMNNSDKVYFTVDLWGNGKLIRLCLDICEDNTYSMIHIIDTHRGQSYVPCLLDTHNTQMWMRKLINNPFWCKFSNTHARLFNNADIEIPACIASMVRGDIVQINTQL
jgi:hypothetical protein